MAGKESFRSVTLLAVVVIAEGTGVAPLRVGIVEVSCGAGVAVEVDSTLAKVVVIVATERGVAEVAAVVIGAAEVEYGAAPVVVVARVARLVVVTGTAVVDVVCGFPSVDVTGNALVNAAAVAAVVIGATEVEYDATPVVVVARVARLVVRMDGVVDVLVAFFEAAIVVVD